MTVIVQRAFSGGEIAPALQGRADTTKYQTGLKLARNFFIRKHGTLANRTGTQYTGVVKVNAERTYLDKFVFSDTQSYAIEIGDEYLRFFTQGGRLVVSGVFTYQASAAITGASQADPCTITAVAHPFTTNDRIYISGIVGMTELNDRVYLVESTPTADTFTLKDLQGNTIDSTGYTLYTSGGTVDRDYQNGELVVYSGTNYWSISDDNRNNVPNVSPLDWYPLSGDILEIPTPYVTADLADLKFEQSNDVVTITHPNYDIYELIRTGLQDWTFKVKAFAPSIDPPINVALSGASGTVAYWAVTSVAPETFEESLISSSVGGSTDATGASPRTISWDQNSEASEYNVYKLKNGVWGFIGVAGQATSPQFIDDGINPDVALTPPTARNPFTATQEKPTTAAYYQQRLLFGGTINDPSKIWGSRSALFNNFTVSSPYQSNDSITFTLVGKEYNAIRHLFDLNTLVVLTATGEYRVEGNVDGILLADELPNPRRIANNGASRAKPILMDSNAVYVQARGNVVRDLRANRDATVLGAFSANDLTIYVPHLINPPRQILKLEYAEAPDSMIFAVRDDGTIMVMTYVPDQDIWGWCVWSTNGWFEDITVIPEGDTDIAYVTVRRIVNGSTVRYVERFRPRDFQDVAIDATFMDSFLTYDGRNTSATTLTLSTAGGWTVDDDITITSSLAQFIAGDVGNSYILNILDTDEESETYNEPLYSIKLDVTAFTSSTVVTARPRKNVPTQLQSVATASWSRCVDEIGNLSHLEGKDISVIGDGNVVASPNNPDYTTVTVASGSATLDDTYCVIHAGLPFTSDMRTLDLDMQDSGIRSAKKLLTHIELLVESSRGIFAGPDEDNLTEYIPEPRTDYESPVGLETGLIEIEINNTWEQTGSFLARQVDPLPLTVLSALPETKIGG